MMNRIKNTYNKYRRVFWFCVAGGTNTLLDYGVYSLLLWATGMRPEICHVIGYTAGIACSFNINRHLTFRAGSGHAGTQIARFLVVNGVTLALSTLSLHYLLRLNVNPFFIKLPVTLGFSVVNYLGYKSYAFADNFRKHHKNKGEAAND